ncbi:MAG TPA: adenosylcobinamide-GDP ribazoletransferase [Stellaceae bacterium]|nr:adenosylcobinamide-GDP ribazoletransferase [Stellaceae bacterium]
MYEADAPSFGWQAQLRYCLMFLTRLPVKLEQVPPPDALALASWCFPLAGIVVGLAGAIGGGIALALGLPPLAVALVAVGASVLATGGLHEDGLADSADGFSAGVDRERKLAVMRDSRIGAHGAVALILVLGLRVALISVAAAHGGEALTATLIVIHAASRAGLPMLMRCLAPARADGLGRDAGRPKSGAAGVGILLAAIIAISALGLGHGIDVVAAVGIATALIGCLARRQIAGYTGDVLGAAQQAAEVAALVAINLAIG